MAVYEYAAVPLTRRNLALLKWRDAKGLEYTFRLVDRVSAEWMDFGMLLDIDLDTLDGWEVQYQANTRVCWERVMDSWLENCSSDYPVTWEGLCTLLQDAGLADVSQELIRALYGSSNGML